MSKKIIIIIVIVTAFIAGIIWTIVSVKNKQPKESSAPQSIEQATSTPSITTIDENSDDQDSDGIKDKQEKELGTSDFNFDTDEDGLNDWNEINEWKTDPKNSDTDGDGYADGVELLRGFNPKGSGKLPAP